MRVRTKEYYRQLADEFGLTLKQVEVITQTPFKVISDSIRKDERKGFLLNNFCRIVPKFKFKPGNELKAIIEDIGLIQDPDQTHTGTGGIIGEEIKDLSEVSKVDSGHADL